MEVVISDQALRIVLNTDTNPEEFINKIKDIIK